MKLPEEISTLHNQYEIGQVSLCGLFSTTVKDADPSAFHHMQGEINALHKLDKHYYGLFGFYAINEKALKTLQCNQDSAFPIHRALCWFGNNNHLYNSFLSNYEILFRFKKPGFINPSLLDDQDIPLSRLLQEEAFGMAFPLDSSFFDQYPLMFEEKDVAGMQHTKLDSAIPSDQLREFVTVKYTEPILEPHLYPWGFSGFRAGSRSSYRAHKDAPL